MCGVVDEVTLKQSFVRILRFSPVIIMPPMVHTRRTNGQSLETFQKSVLFRKSGSIGWKSTFAVVSKVKCIVVPGEAEDVRPRIRNCVAVQMWDVVC